MTLNKLLASAAKVFGLPVANVERDVWAIGRSIVTETGNLPLQYEMEKAIYNIGSEKNKSRFEDIMYRALEAGEMDTYWHIRDEMMRMTPKVDGTTLDSAMKSRYKARQEDDKSYTLPQKAMDLTGLQNALAEEEEKAKAYGAGNLGSEDYQKYAEQRAVDYRQSADALANNPIFKGMDDKTKDDVLEAAYELARDGALVDVSGGQYKPKDEWIGKALDAEKKGIDNWKYVLWQTTQTDTTDVKDESGKKVKGETRKDQLSDWLSDSSWLTDDQREFLWGTEYNDDYGDYRDDLAEYRSYGPQMDAAYEEMSSGLADNPIFTGMDKETRDKVTDAAMSVAKQRAQAEVIEDFEYDAQWIAKTGEAEEQGIAPEDYVLWHVVAENTSSDRDENNKEIDGQRKQDKLRRWLQNNDTLTEQQKYWLWRQIYKTAEW